MRRDASSLWGRVLLLLAALLAAGLLLFPAPARSSTYPLDPNTGVAWVNECAGADTACLAITERLESLTLGLQNVADLVASADATAQGDAASIVLAVNESSAGGGGGALTVDEHDALNLVWYGVWALVGLTLVLLISPALTSLLRVTRGM